MSSNYWLSTRYYAIVGAGPSGPFGDFYQDCSQILYIAGPFAINVPFLVTFIILFLFAYGLHHLVVGLLVFSKTLLKWFQRPQISFLKQSKIVDNNIFIFKILCLSGSSMTTCEYDSGSKRHDNFFQIFSSV